MDENSGGSGLVRYGKLQVAQATQIQPGAAAVAYQPQQDLVAGRTAGDHAGGVIEDPHLGHGHGAPTAGAAPDGGRDIDPDDVLEPASKPVAVGPQIRAGHGCLPSRSVAPEPLLAPGVAVVVVAEALPEARLVGVQQLDPADPLGALPQIQVGDQPPRRAAVLGLQVLAVVAECDPGLVVGQVLQGQVGAVAAIGLGEREAGARVHVGQQGV